MLFKRLGAVLMLIGTLGVVSCASRGEDRRNRAEELRDSVGSAATTPFRDLNLIREEIPPVLAAIRYPYDTASLASGCTAVAYEIGLLDAVLGTESYQPGQDDRNWSERGADLATDAANDAVRGTGEILPFRGWVRSASGANRAEREAIRAFEMGQMRRSFLRGYGSSLGCRGVVPQPPPPR